MSEVNSTGVDTELVVTILKTFCFLQDCNNKFSGLNFTFYTKTTWTTENLHRGSVSVRKSGGETVGGWEADLADDALDEFVHGEGDVGVDGEHFPQRVLVLRRLHVSVQQVPHHLQEG